MTRNGPHGAAATKVRVKKEVSALKSYAASLEELLKVLERTSLEQARKLENSLELAETNLRLSGEIEERKATEKALRNSERFLQSAIDALSAQVAILDESGKIMSTNKTWKRFVSENCLAGQNIGIGMNYLHVCDVTKCSDEAAAAAKGIREVINLERDGVHSEYPCVASDGKKWFAIRITRFEGESPVRVVVAHEDITERKRIEEKLRKSHDELELRVRQRTAELSAIVAKLEMMNQELQEFAFAASHDLQEPLRKIQTFSDLAQQRCKVHLDSTGQEYLDRITSLAGHMRELLNGLLQYSRVSSRPEPFKTIDLAKIARQAAAIFEKDLQESGGLIEIESMPELEADESQMLRLFQNLIDNALKFRSPESPRIKIYARPEGKRCEIFVLDNGIGFEQRFAERIFKPFQRLHGRSEYEGTGMGLAICRKIIERHGGEIRAESEPGKGSTFIISLPVKQTLR